MRVIVIDIYIQFFFARRFLIKIILAENFRAYAHPFRISTVIHIVLSNAKISNHLDIAIRRLRGIEVCLPKLIKFDLVRHLKICFFMERDRRLTI